MSRIVLIVAAAIALSLTQCGPSPSSPPSSPSQSSLPTTTACGQWAVSCMYDGYPDEPGQLRVFRPTLRWGITHLKWYLHKPTAQSQLDRTSQLTAIRDAISVWEGISPLVFEEAQEGESAQIVIRFEAPGDDLGDGTTFDMPGAKANEMARAFFPGTARAGLIQLDDAEPWSAEQTSGGVYLPRVLAHEIGHTLGLEHLSGGNSCVGIMCSGYDPTDLGLSPSPEDVAALRALYGSADGTIPPEPLPTRDSLAGATLPQRWGGEPDTDHDGIPDSVERLALDTNPESPDTDGDGIDDRTAVFIKGMLAVIDRPLVPQVRVDTTERLVPIGQSVVLDASNSFDPQHFPLAYRCRQVRGPAVTLQATAPSAVSFVAPSVDQDTWLTFKLTAVSRNGTRAAATISLLVWKDVRPTHLLADAGPDQRATRGSWVILDGTGSIDPNGTFPILAWQQIAGYPVDLKAPAAQRPRFVAPNLPTDSTLTFQVRASNQSESATDTVDVLVRTGTTDSDGDGLSDDDEDFLGTDPSNPDTDGDGWNDHDDPAPLDSERPVALRVAATGKPAAGSVPMVVDLSAWAVGGAPPYAYAWAAAPAVTIGGANTASPTATLATAGTYTFICTVIDSAGVTATANVTITATGSTP